MGKGNKSELFCILPRRIHKFDITKSPFLILIRQICSIIVFVYESAAPDPSIIWCVWKDFCNLLDVLLLFHWLFIMCDRAVNVVLLLKLGNANVIKCYWAATLCAHVNYNVLLLKVGLLEKWNGEGCVYDGVSPWPLVLRSEWEVARSNMYVWPNQQPTKKTP